MHTAGALRSEENIGPPGTDVISCNEIPDVWVVGIEPVFSPRSPSALNTEKTLRSFLSQFVCL